MKPVTFIAVLVAVLMCGVSLLLPQEPEVIEDAAPPVPADVAEPVLTVEAGSYWPCRVVRVLDGDTLDVEVRKVYRIRLLDCWAAELHGPQKEAGIRARVNLESLAKDKSGIVVIPWKPEAKDELTLNRYLGRLIVNGVDVGKEQVRKKLAGKTKEELGELFPE